MLLNKLSKQFRIFFLPDVFKLDHIEVAKRIEVARFVEHVGDAAAHPSGEVAAGFAEDNDCPAGHIFAAVVADAFDDGGRAAVPDAEPLARHAVDKYLAAGAAVEKRIADDDIFVRRKRCDLRAL